MGAHERLEPPSDVRLADPRRPVRRPAHLHAELVDLVRRRRPHLHGPPSVPARGRSSRLGQPERLRARDEGGRRRARDLLRPRRHLVVRASPPGQPVVPDPGRHAEALLGLWRSPGQRLVGRPLGHLQLARRATRSMGALGWGRRLPHDRGHDGQPHRLRGVAIPRSDPRRPRHG